MLGVDLEDDAQNKAREPTSLPGLAAASVPIVLLRRHQHIRLHWTRELTAQILLAIRQFKTECGGPWWTDAVRELSIRRGSATEDTPQDVVVSTEPRGRKRPCAIGTVSTFLFHINILNQDIDQHVRPNFSGACFSYWIINGHRFDSEKSSRGSRCAGDSGGSLSVGR
jgi:hypothetical protein